MNEPKRDLQETESHGESISRLQKDREEGPYTQIPPDLRPSIHSKSEPQSSALSQPDVSSSLANKRQDLFKEKISYLIEGVQLITRIFTLASALLYIFSSFRCEFFSLFKEIPSPPPKRFLSVKTLIAKAMVS